MIGSRRLFVVCALALTMVGSGCFTLNTTKGKSSKSADSNLEDSLSDDEGSGVPLPTAAPTSVPSATATPVPSATATPVPSATATPVPGATATPVPGATATPVPGASPTPTPLPGVAFAQANAIIQSAKCAMCHAAAGGIAPSLIFATEAAWVASRSAAGLPMVVPGNAVGSVLFQRLAGNGLAAPINNNMPLSATPPGTPLTPAEIEQIRTWINGIAP